MKRLFKLFTLLFLCFYTAIAQESLKKHTVSSGETLLSISKKYNVTPFDLQKANPGAIEGIKEDDLLIIPESKIKTPIIESIADSIKASVVNSSISHTVKTGETKFGLAKRFGLTVTQLESQNPQLINGLNVGQVLEIYPSTIHTTTDQAKTQAKAKTSPPQNQRDSREGKTHSVLPRETVFSIASDNGVTVDELLEANSKTISGILKIGQILWIPGSNEFTASGSRESYVVKNGDTKFSLSRRFDTSIREMERQNPHITKMLIIGQVINMATNETSRPKSQVASPKISNNQTVPPIDDVKEVEAIVVVSEVPSEAPTEEVEEEKVVITEIPSEEIIEKEKTEETVVVTKTPSEEITQEEKKQEKKEELVITTTAPLEAIEESTTADGEVTSEDNYIIYKIQPDETIYGLAKKAGMPIPEFRELNPQLIQSVQVGTLIKMPKNETVSKTIANTDEPLILPKSTSSYTDLRISANTSQSKRLLFFLPFSEIDYQNYAVNNDNFKNVSDDFKRTHLEFYKGANIAIDSIRKMKLNLEVDVIEVQSTNQTSKIKSLIQENTIKDYDAIILPFYKTVEEEVAAFTADRNIPVITASTIAHQNNTNNLYSALPSINQQRLKALNYMMAKQAHIIVLSDVNRAESKAFIADHVPNADFVNIKKNGSFSEGELISKFKKDQLNYVIIDSERNSIFLNVTNALLSQLSNYKLQLAVLEASLIPDDSDVSRKRYRILKMIFPSLIPAKSTTISKQFLSAYQTKYNLLPSSNIMLGFDITFDSLLRLLQQQSFENSATNYITEYTQLKFNYEKNTLGGYSNEGIYILQYDSDANIRDAN